MRRSLRRVVLLVATPALALSTLAVTPSATAESGALGSAPVAGAAGWLTGQLTDGILLNEQYDNYPDVGLTIDAALGLAAVDAHDGVQAIATAVDDPAVLSTYIGDGETDAYAGSTAKALLLAQAQGDPVDFGGVDLVDRLESLVLTEGDVAGRIQDRSAYGDYTNVISQAYAVAGLDAAGSTLTDATTDFLLQQQCADGYFRLYLPAATDDQATCDQASSPASVDATAIAVRALLPQDDDLDVSPALTAALDWLAGQQADDGSLGGGSDDAVANTNSTGLAGWAFGLAGRTTAAGAAADWILERQVSAADACQPNALRRDLGAIAYDDAGRSAGEVDGITVPAQDQWRRASAQALPALQWSSASPMGDITFDGPRKFSQDGISLSVSGLAEGEQVCLRGKGIRDLLVGPDALAYEIKAPNRTVHRSYTLTRLGAAPMQVETTVLAARKLPFRLKKERVAAGRRQVVKIRGLEAGERVTVRFRGQRVDRGHAGPAGRYVSTFRVTDELGTAKVKVIGRFANRTHRKSFVVR